MFNIKSLLKNPAGHFKITFEGFNTDITEPYYWHLQFPLLVNVGYKMLKVEDDHYFSENNKFGVEYRQIKGGAIQAFQNNLTKLIELLKFNLLPALEEVKLAELYYNWFKEIEETTKELANEKDEEKRKELIRRRNEAILHLKSKWVTEVDGGRLFEIAKRSEEGGRDFVLVPELFFGTYLEKPLDTKTIAKQLEEIIMPIEPTEETKRVAKDFLYRFHMWLPSALKETKVTFSLRKNVVRQLYSQVQLMLHFMKPLLKEIAKKQEKLGKENFYEAMDDLDPFLTSILDSSYTHIKLLLIRERNITLDDLKINDSKFKVKKNWIERGKAKGKEGIIKGIKEDKYIFIEKGSNEEILIERTDLKKYPCMVIDFSQKRYTQIIDTPQGKSLAPYNSNTIEYRGYSWDLYECALFIKSLQLEEIELLEQFAGDLSILKEDLMRYGAEVGKIPEYFEEKPEKPKEKKEKTKKKEENPLLLPFKALYEMFFIPKNIIEILKISKPQQIKEDLSSIDHAKVRVLEEMWKTYTTFKKSHGFMQY